MSTTVATENKNHPDDDLIDELSEVIPGFLWQGSAAAAAANVRKLAAHGVVNCAAAELAPNYRNPAVRVLKLCWEDCDAQQIFPGVVDAYNFIKEIQAQDNGRGRVVVHCHAGISRSSAVVLYFLIREQRLDFETAYRRLRQRHFFAWPNLGFRQQLQAYCTAEEIVPRLGDNERLQACGNNDAPRLWLGSRESVVAAFANDELNASLVTVECDDILTPMGRSAVSSLLGTEAVDEFITNQHARRVPVVVAHANGASAAAAAAIVARYRMREQQPQGSL